MAATKLISYDNLQTYDGLIKGVISTTEAKSLHTVLFDTTNKQIKFFKKENATLADTADYTIDIPADLDGSATIASEASGVVTLKAGISQVDGVVGNSSASDITLAKVATTGAAEDISIADAGGLITATNVEDALQELASASAGGVASKNIWVEDESAGQSDYAKVYKIYQCATQAEEAAGTLKGTINIPKDLFIKSASVETVTTADVPYTGAVPGDKYIDIEVQNQTAHLYVPCNSLVDEYTAEQSATQIQLAIDSNNVISGAIVAGSVTATELATDAVTTAKITDSNVTKAKLAQAVQDSLDLADSAVQSVTASDPTTGTNGTITVDGTEVAVKGLGSAAYTASTAYEAAGAVSTAIAALDSSTATATNTADTGLAVLSEVTIADGLIDTKKTVTLGTMSKEAATDYLDKATYDYSVASTADIQALFTTP